ncbi:hypothetical protein IBL26_19180 [Roseomonas aerophila]|uniref:Uncharacterized protein n=1 Tax=Teichococcus aerophilus TaxID=1224513 RepID=A0ABR7RSA8_9PROT|nr:hypothetical protein [Pseudoroseomonas aerophila]MBC9208977.1 hypothetical protein [Pseudoroseomonas aerophila]
MRVGLGAANAHLQPLPCHGHHVAQRQADQLGAAQRRAKANQQQRAVTGTDWRVGCRPRRQHLAQQIRGGGGLPARPGVGAAGDALQDHAQAGVAKIERQAGQAVRCLDGCQMHAQGGDRAAIIGQAHGVHGDGVGIGAERVTAEAGAPGGIGTPGAAVDAAGALPPSRVA